MPGGVKFLNTGLTVQQYHIIYDVYYIYYVGTYVTFVLTAIIIIIIIITLLSVTIITIVLHCIYYTVCNKTYFSKINHGFV
jgi:hypothetical protein